MHETFFSLHLDKTVLNFKNYLELEWVERHHLLLHGLLDHGPLGGHAHVAHVSES